MLLAGLTGVGKTALLAELASDGEQVLDLEGLASHRGSAFGGLGRVPQPSQREFSSAVRLRLAQADPSRVLWIEDEGPFIGRLALPDGLQRVMTRAPAIELQASVASRVARIAATYGRVARSDLEAAVERSATRLGPVRTDAVLDHLRAGDLSAAIRAALPAYDSAYAHRARRTGRRILAVVDVGDAPGHEGAGP